MAGRGRRCRSDQETSLAIRSVVATQPSNLGKPYKSEQRTSQIVFKINRWTAARRNIDRRAGRVR